MPKIEYKIGNMFTQLPEPLTPVIIPHVVNNIGAWGAGFVVPLGRTFPKAQQTYLDWSTGKITGRPFELGSSLPAKVDENRFVHHMCAQNGVRSATNPKPIKYRALANCLHSVNNFCSPGGVEVHAPAFGSDLAGGDWRVIAALIEELLTDPKAIYIYTLTSDQQEKLLAQL